MKPQLEKTAEPFGVKVISVLFDSVTVKHAMAKMIVACGKPVEVLHVGDYDREGQDIFTALSEDVTAFVAAMGGSVQFTRCAGPDRRRWAARAARPERVHGKPCTRRAHPADRHGQAPPPRPAAARPEPALRRTPCPGRPLFDRPMTAAERQRRHRLKVAGGPAPRLRREVLRALEAGLPAGELRRLIETLLAGHRSAGTPPEA